MRGDPRREALPREHVLLERGVVRPAHVRAVHHAPDAITFREGATLKDLFYDASEVAADGGAIRGAEAEVLVVGGVEGDGDDFDEEFVWAAVLGEGGIEDERGRFGAGDLDGFHGG